MTRLLQRIVCLAWLPLAACGDNHPIPDDHGPIAQNIMAPMGEPLPLATPEQLATFARGKAVALRRFSRSQGLGPAFNVTFCGSCHEKPTIGGSGGLYRNFFLAGFQVDGGAFGFGHAVTEFDCGEEMVPPEDRTREPPIESRTGIFQGVVRQFYYGDDETARPAIDIDLNTVAQRNPIPFFGAGLLAAIDGDEIRKRADPNDSNQDGISGRINLATGFVGRFGRKSQTTSIEGFIRGPLFNHLGITSDPLSIGQRARLPVDSSGVSDDRQAVIDLGRALHTRAQAAAPSTTNCDVDDVLDPELAPDDLFDLVSFTMLMAAPEIEPLNEQRRRGTRLFGELGCNGCHTPRLESPYGPLPVYSDLLLHDMGPELADGLVMGEAQGDEYRTQPLWGLTATGPYLHDGRAVTVDEAIRWHGGEAEASRVLYESITDAERGDVLEFLASLGGRAQRSAGMIPPNTPVPSIGTIGGPRRVLNEEEQARFVAGRDLFDAEFGHSDGVGGPRLNGDSCRACHFDPVVGGAGPRGVNVMRHGIAGDGGSFVVPAIGTILHKTTSMLRDLANMPQPEATIFEHRQTPPLFGLGLIDDLPESVILANADPNDDNDDGISGKAAIVDGGRLGRFGWKAQVPNLAEFVRDAVGAELGMTLPPQEGLTFGQIHDNDDVADPELTLDDAALLEFFMLELGPPPRRPSANPALEVQGAMVFENIGCSDCHIPTLDGPSGPVSLFSDLLLHDILPAGQPGIEDGTASTREFRTPPLWGLATTPPYLHSGEADTIDEAIRLHAGEADETKTRYESLSSGEREALLEFLNTL